MASSILIPSTSREWTIPFRFLPLLVALMQHSWFSTAKCVSLPFSVNSPCTKEVNINTGLTKQAPVMGKMWYEDGVKFFHSGHTTQDLNKKWTKVDLSHTQRHVLVWNAVLKLLTIVSIFCPLHHTSIVSFSSETGKNNSLLMVVF